MIDINYRRASEVFALMLERYRKRAFPYESMERYLPQTLVPERVKDDPEVHARYLCFSCLYMRGTVESRHAFKVLARLHDKESWLFTKEVLHASPEEIGLLLKEQIEWKHAEIGRHWSNNARILDESWNGDPRNIFSGVRTKEALYRRVMGAQYRRPNVRKGRRSPKSRYEGLRGFREKMTSMLSYFLEDAGLIGSNPLSAPVDFHHLRVYLATRMIDFDGESVSYEKIFQHGIKIAEYLQRTNGLPQVEYGNIVWLWSLRLCKRAPHNRTTEIVREDGRKLRVPVPVVWTPEQIRAYDRTCGRCVLADDCQFGIPSGHYYNADKLLRIGKDQPPQGRLFLAKDLPYEVPDVSEETDMFLSRFEAGD